MVVQPGARALRALGIVQLEGMYYYEWLSVCKNGRIAGKSEATKATVQKFEERGYGM